MDGFVAFVILLIVISLLEKVLKSGKQKGKGAPPPPEVQGEAGDGEGLPKNLGDLIAEELGFNLERRPTVKQLPESSMGGATAEWEVDERREPSRRGELDTAADRARAETPRPWYPAPPARQRPSPPAERRPSPPPAEWRPVDVEDPNVISLEERAMRQRGEAVSLERERVAEDHERFHDRYDVPRPVASHQEFHDRYITRQPRAAARRSAISLPDRRTWNDVQRAIIWAEVLGPPKGLE